MVQWNDSDTTRQKARKLSACTALLGLFSSVKFRVCEPYQLFESLVTKGIYNVNEIRERNLYFFNGAKNVKTSNFIMLHVFMELWWS